MRLSLITIGCLVSLISPQGQAGNAEAEPNFSFYGRLHLALNRLDADSQSPLMRVSNNTSRFGLRGDVEIRPGLRGVMQFEASVNTESQRDLLGLRDSFIGLQGRWGLLRVGKIGTSLKALRSRTDLFSEQIGDARNIVRGNYAGQQGFDERFDNSINYRTPAWNGWTGELHYTAQPGVRAESDDAWSTSLTYQQGPVRFAMARERWNETPAGQSRSKTRASGYLDHEQWRFIALAQRANNPDDVSWGLGVQRKLSDRLILKSQYYRLEAQDSDFDSQMFVIGASHQTTASMVTYLHLGRTGNGESQNRTPWRQSSNLSPNLAPGQDGSAVALGMIYSF